VGTSAKTPKRVRRDPVAPEAPRSKLTAGHALPFVAIFLLALAVRLIHLWQIRRAPFFTLLIGDGRAYDLWAQRIAAGDWIGQDVFYQAPLYAYFLAAIYTIAGHDLLVVRLVQAGLGSLACALVAAAGSRLFSRPAGIAAGLILAVYAPAIFFDGLIQKSALDLILLAVMLWLLARWLIDQPALTWPWLVLGVALGALSLSRENALAFTLVLIVWAVSRGRRITTANLRAAGTLVLGLAIVLLPVAVRNLSVGGEFHVTTSQFGPNFYIGNNPRATGGYDPLRPGRGGAQYEREDATSLAEQAAGRRLTPAEVSRYWTSEALTFIRSQPAAWLALMATKVGLLINATEIMDTESQATYADWSTPLALTGWVGHFGVLVPLALLGIVVTWRDRKRTGVLIALTAVYALSVVLFYVFARYRYPLVPFLVLFGGAGIVALPRFVRATPRPVLIGTAAAMVLVAVFAHQPIVQAELTQAVMASNMGQALWSDGRLDEAIAEYRRAIRLKPDWAPAHYNLGNALREAGRPAEAEAQFRQALALQPDYPRARLSLGATLLSAGRAREALEHLRPAVAAMPESSEAHRTLGIALSREHRQTEAIAAFREALRLDPDSAEAHNDLGVALATQGDMRAAAERFERALAIKPDFAEATRNLEAARRIMRP
jgi:Flp pilus assembly protein TadD